MTNSSLDNLHSYGILFWTFIFNLVCVMHILVYYKESSHHILVLLWRALADLCDLNSIKQISFLFDCNVRAQISQQEISKSKKVLVVVEQTLSVKSNHIFFINQILLSVMY